MGWKTRLAFLFLLSVPSLCGYPLDRMPAEVLTGVKSAWVIYFAASQAAIRWVSGPRLQAITLSIAALIAMPVVYGGAAVSCLLLLAGWNAAGGQAVFSAHYVTLCLTMLTVIPLALAMVAAIPFQELEQNLLRAPRGVTRTGKTALMFVRVFNHIVFFVIPSILEVVREEGRFRPGRSAPGAAQPAWKRLSALAADLTQVGVEGICASIQYVPIWALEISRLPEKERRTP